MNGLLRPARRTTLADDVYESVRALVMDHAVAPGERINIDALARRLEVSPTPVREALARLEADGLVRKRPLAGYTAAPLLTRAEFDELVEMRLILETASAHRVAERFSGRRDATGSDSDSGSGDRAAAGNGDGAGADPPGSADVLAQLRREAELPDQVPGTEGFAAIAAFTAQDARFHHLLAERSGNRMLHAAVVRLRAHLHLFRLHFPTAHYGTSAREHLRIVDAIGTGDPDAAGSAMRAHLLAAADRHLPFFEGS
ncbi:GntR family transcriptional regulator [Plantactinospora endophytica]|uniref:GntR family transcriptional regulator n=1 Tax=Plantactinospora endophytica TaxID=673535 RepID=A0ABQ4EAR5_9ACTN|nr:GntR family transcriptional regulator [Plantactinospora endophytica]GIG91818.1 GntR family transcriptional regulator [Plantactinospora endophytica]